MSLVPSFLTPSSDDEDAEDSTSEGEVFETCDHDWEEEPVEDSKEFIRPPLPSSPMTEAIVYEEGYLHFPVFQKHRQVCSKCGVEGAQFFEKTAKVAVGVAYEMEPEMDPSEVIPAYDGGDAGRVITNDSDASYGVTD